MTKLLFFAVRKYFGWNFLAIYFQFNFLQRSHNISSFSFCTIIHFCLAILLHSLLLYHSLIFKLSLSLFIYIYRYHSFFLTPISFFYHFLYPFFSFSLSAFFSFIFLFRHSLFLPLFLSPLLLAQARTHLRN